MASSAPVASAPASKQRSTRGPGHGEVGDRRRPHHPEAFGVRGHDVRGVASVRHDAVHLVAGAKMLTQQADRDLGDGERVGCIDAELGRRRGM